jgi:hypothetical protein
VTPDEVTLAVCHSRSAAVLVLGPGGWELLDRLRDVIPLHSVYAALAADDVRVLREELWMASERTRTVAVNLNGASERVQNMLLKALEDPPGQVRFVLASAVRPLPTVVSRCWAVTLGREAAASGLPEPADVAEVGTALRTAADQPAMLAAALRGILPAQVRLLARWASEAATGRWQTFGPDFAPDIDPVRAQALVAELARWDGTRLGPLVALRKAFSPG